MAPRSRRRQNHIERNVSPLRRRQTLTDTYDTGRIQRVIRIERGQGAAVVTAGDAASQKRPAFEAQGPGRGKACRARQARGKDVRPVGVEEFVLAALNVAVLVEK